jgi:hypothetical protein
MCSSVVSWLQQKILAKPNDLTALALVNRSSADNVLMTFLHRPAPPHPFSWTVRTFPSPPLLRIRLSKCHANRPDLPFGPAR